MPWPEIAGVAAEPLGGSMDSCYLCGHLIGVEEASVDHVPAKQVFAKSIRDQQNLSGLVTLPAHAACNGAYSRDEEYFVWSLAPLAIDSTAGRALVRDNASKFVSGKSKGLGFKSLGEFDRNPSGLILPRNLVIKRVEGKRIGRVVWKVVRGLFAVEHHSALPEDTPFMLESFEPERGSESTNNPVWEAVKAEPGKGAYPGAFDYKYLLGDDGGLKVHLWGLLFWDRIMFFVAHHHPAERRPPNKRMEPTRGSSKPRAAHS